MINQKEEVFKLPFIRENMIDVMLMSEVVTVNNQLIYFNYLQLNRNIEKYRDYDVLNDYLLDERVNYTDMLKQINASLVMRGYKECRPYKQIQIDNEITKLYDATNLQQKDLLFMKNARNGYVNQEIMLGMVVNNPLKIKLEIMNMKPICRFIPA